MGTRVVEASGNIAILIAALRRARPTPRAP
jgi:hypothetical protein